MQVTLSLLLLPSRPWTSLYVCVLFSVDYIEANSGNNNATLIHITNALFVPYEQRLGWRVFQSLSTWFIVSEVRVK